MGSESDIFQLQRKVSSLEGQLERLEEFVKSSFEVERHHLIRIKNGDVLSDDYILNDHGYMDLSPEKAFQLYNDKDRDFILLDVSSEGHKPPTEIAELRNIPLEDLKRNLYQLPGKGKNILVMSEYGVRSVIACKLLNKAGYYNLSHVSGGHKFWPGHRLENYKDTESELA